MSSFCATCNQANATSVCTGCKCTYYCNRDCQRRDWKKRHKKICKSLKRKADLDSVKLVKHNTAESFKLEKTLQNAYDEANESMLEHKEDKTQMIHVNKASRQHELIMAEDQFHVSRHLMVMGFGHNISLDAVKRYGSNLQRCITFIKDEQEQAEEEHEQKERKLAKISTAKEDDKQAYQQRIDALLLEQRLKQEHDDVYNIYELVDRQYANNNGLDGFIADCGEYAMNIDRIFVDNVNTCELNECEYIQREYRNKSIYDNYETIRFELYAHCDSEKCVIIQQFVDQMHINKYHLTDVGLRHIKNDENDRAVVTETDIAKPDWAPVYLDVIAQRKRFDKMMKNDRTKSNKFVTKVLEHDGNDSYSKDSNYTPYSFGIRFYYHKYYQNNSTKCEVLPETKPAVFEFGNAHINSKYSYSSWFVSPKHKSMKDEVLNATNHSLTIIQYENTVMKAIMKHKAIRGTIKGAGSLWKVVYEIPKGSRISEQHILAVLLYTNHIDLSASFSRSFHKLKGTERDDEIKERHSHYANWARILRETVECWGYSLWETAKTRSTFHHGISKQMTFDGFSHRFCGPTSTTLQYETAMISLFANQHEGEEEGVLISFKNNKKAASFFDCIRWSDCSGESEMLFLGGFNPLEICGLTIIDNKVNRRYIHWINAIKAFRAGMIDGQTSAVQVTPSDAEFVDLLIANALHKRKHLSAVDIIPEYVETLFESKICKATNIIMDIGNMNADICYVEDNGDVRYGYEVLKHLYFDNKNQIKWKRWPQLFPCLQTINIQNITNCKYSESLLVDDVMMLRMLSFLKKNKIKRIEVFCPLNSMDSLHKLVRTHSNSYEKIEYRLVVDTNYSDPKHGSCTVFTCILF